MDFLGSQKVLPMKVEERGAYMQLLILAWDNPVCSLPADLDVLKRMALWRKELGSFKRVRACFEDHPDVPGRLYNPRLYEEWKYCQEKSAAARESAHHRHNKNQAVVPGPTQKLHDRESKGFTALSSDVAKIADKYFKPI